MQLTRWRHRLAVIVLLGLVLGVGGCSEGKERYGSPDGHREVVIERGTWVIDTIWTLTVREKGLFGYRRDIGCFTDDDPESGTPTGVTWANADEIVIATTAGSAGVRVKLNSDGSAQQITQAGNDHLAPCPAG